MPPRSKSRGGAQVGFADNVRSPVSVAGSPLPSPSTALPPSPTNAHAHGHTAPVLARLPPDVLAPPPVSSRGPSRRGSQPTNDEISLSVGLFRALHRIPTGRRYEERPGLHCILKHADGREVEATGGKWDNARFGDYRKAFFLPRSSADEGAIVRIEARDPPPHIKHGEVICVCEVPLKTVVDTHGDYRAAATSHVAEWQQACEENKTEFVLNAETISQWHEREAQAKAAKALADAARRQTEEPEAPRENIFKKMQRVGQPLPGVAPAAPAPVATPPVELDQSFDISGGEEKRTPQKKGVNFNIPESKDNTHDEQTVEPVVEQSRLVIPGESDDIDVPQPALTLWAFRLLWLLCCPINAAVALFAGEMAFKGVRANGLHDTISIEMLVIALAAGWSTINCITKAMIGEGLPLEQLNASRPANRPLPFARRAASWWAAFNSLVEATLIAATIVVPWTLGRGFHLAVGFFQVSLYNVQVATMTFVIMALVMSLLYIIRHCGASPTTQPATAPVLPDPVNAADPDAANDVTNVVVKQQLSARFSVEVALAFVSLVFALLVWRATGARQPGSYTLLGSLALLLSLLFFDNLLDVGRLVFWMSMIHAELFLRLERVRHF